ncbi:hypothetical protein C1645_817238 [Glomus cerebriforme]|uniref:Uncharacterized protein n=1 Tax=Glomus cerebriforme TaxID=658196 RepID=A0A397T9V0_9GLOM|nr:hypothetical protein C1645_817238 [Glomus cerebriforme]
MSTEVIIPETQVVHLEDDVISKPKEENFSINDLNSKPTSIKQDDLDTPPSPGSLNPPPPYSQCSQWDELSIEQLLEKSREVLNAECLKANGGDKKEKDGEVLDKMTQLESLVSSLQSILSDQTFAMHDLRSQLSDIQIVLKKMQDKQETISSEEVMKQVVTMKALTENIIASSEVKKQLDAANTAKLAAAKQQQQQQETASENEKNSKLSSTEEHQFSPPMSILPINSMPRTVPKQQSRTVSRAPSRNPSRPGSRTVSPAYTPVSLSRTSSRNKLDSNPGSPSIRPYKVNEFPTINENCEEGDDDNESCGEDTPLDRMLGNIASLLSEATKAVDTPIKGREKDRAFSNISVESIDFDEINRELDEMYGDNEDEEDDDDEFEEPPIEMNNALRPESAEKEGRWPRKHKRTKSGSNKDDFLRSLNSFNDSMTGLESLIEGLTTELPQDEGDALDGIQYRVPTDDLINNPSSDVPDLDDFAQQCRLLTRALILPFLHATHSFMSESLQTTSNIQTPRSVTSTTRTFMNLMYWTFLFTLGSLVLDAWLCEVAGRQVIRMVELLKPGQPFGIIANGYGGYGTIDMDQQDGGIGMLEDGKKKNVKFRTGPKMKAVTWKGAEKGIAGNGRKWWREGAEGVLNLGRRGGRLLTGGRWGSRSTVGRFEDEEYSEESDEWEIVDFDTSDDDDSLSGEEGNEEDPALLLRRRITNERLKRAGHTAHENYAIKEGGNAVNNDVTSTKDQESDIQDDNLTRTFNNSEDSKIKTFTEESDSSHIMDDYYIDDDDDDLDIPGSFPTAFKWTPPPSTMVDVTDRVRRVRSVVLRRPKRNGPFGGSGGFWVMNTRKVRTISNSKDKDTIKSSNKSSPIANKSSKSSLTQKRTWVRRNSI